MPQFPSAIELSSLNGTNGFRIAGLDAGDGSCGTSLAGDVNGDGFDDILVVAPSGDPDGNIDVGESYVVFGKASGFGSAFDLASLNGTNGFRIDGIDASSGASSAAGDFNGDGFDDILVGARFAHNFAGESFVVFGKAAGFAAAVDLSSLNGSNGFRMEGIDAHDWSGDDMSSAGDINGDGFDDILIGADFGDPGRRRDAGESYVVFGKATGFASTLDLASLNGSNGFRLDGIHTYDRSGRSVSSAGDFNGDGFDDIVIGALGADSHTGESYVVFGKASGYTATFALASLNGSNGFRLDGIDTGDESGIAVSDAGDINGDGFTDILIGAIHANPGGDTDAGECYVVFGKVSGFASALDLASLDGKNGFRLDGIDPGDITGDDVFYTPAGDVNGDGFSDILIGTFAGDPGGNADAGETYIVFGKASSWTSAFDLASLDGRNGFRLDGIDAGDVSGGGVSSAGDINNDGFDDILIGAPGANGGVGESYVIFGHATTGAQDDDFAIAEDGNVAGNVFTDNGHGVDTDSASGTLAVASVNGVAANVGQQIALASGALVKVLANGTLSYDPNDAFDHLPAPGSGAANTSALDSFTYKLADGTGAAVTVAIAGIDSNDVIQGTAGADTLRGGIGIDLLGGDIGNDSLDGGAANDRLYGGANRDTLLGSGGSDRLLGQAGGDTLFGQSGNDRLSGASGNDSMTGGDGIDRFVFDVAAFGKDTILDFEDAIDRLWFKTAVADAFADLVIANNGTTAVTLSVTSHAGQSVLVEGTAPITLTAADFVFFA